MQVRDGSPVYVPMGRNAILDEATNAVVAAQLHDADEVEAQLDRLGLRRG